MFKKIVQLLKSSLLFWRDLVLEENRKELIRKNLSDLRNQAVILSASVLAVFVVCRAVNPAIKGVCRIVLQSEDDDTNSKVQNMIIGVEARKAVRGTTLREVKSIGTLKANAEVVIKAEIPGKIAEILFTEGSDVQEGDELIRFESDLYKSEREKNQAMYTLRKAEFERVEKLYNQKVGSQKNYDEALAQMNEAKAQLDSSTFQLSKTVIRAPFNGTIGIMKGSVSPGNIVQQHTELVDIVDNSYVRAEFSVPVKYISEIAVGQSVEIVVDAFKDRVFNGSLDAIDSEVDTKNNSILVRAVIPNRNGNLKHGMFATITLVTGEKTDVILIDEDALGREGAVEFVWVVDEKGRAYRKRVLTGAKDASGVEILAGLKEGDVVVISGQHKLTDGAKTKILNKEHDGDSSEETEDTTQEDENKSDGDDSGNGDEESHSTNSSDEKSVEEKADGARDENSSNKDEDGKSADADKDDKKSPDTNEAEERGEREKDAESSQSSDERSVEEKADGENDENSSNKDENGKSADADKDDKKSPDTNEVEEKSKEDEEQTDNDGSEEETVNKNEEEKEKQEEDDSNADISEPNAELQKNKKSLFDKLKNFFSKIVGHTSDKKEGHAE
ncbi:MAG: efflux RND transporter periplasmic adaptor subunit [Holosporales bacterium]|jgi:membrane fusion protein (multidrug efflux system)|nr:efflux RND transporter periplasmic adaptor subunit [Holosporales bacterium]